MLSSISWIIFPDIVSPSALLGTFLKLHKGLILQQRYIGTVQIGLSGGLSEKNLWDQAQALTSR